VICAFRWVILCNLRGLPFTSLLFNQYFGLYGTQIFQVDTCTQFYFLALQWTISLSCSKSARYYMWPTTLGKMGYVPNKFTQDTLLLFVIEMEVSMRKIPLSVQEIAILRWVPNLERLFEYTQCYIKHEVPSPCCSEGRWRQLSTCSCLIPQAAESFSWITICTFHTCRW